MQHFVFKFSCNNMECSDDLFMLVTKEELFLYFPSFFFIKFEVTAYIFMKTY